MAPRGSKQGPPAAASPRSRKGRQTRQRLVEAAKTVFERSGFLTARVTDIVSEAGISHGAFYHYFDSKEQIFREVASEQEISMTRLSRHVDHDGEDRGAYDKIRGGNELYLRAYRSEAAIMRVIEEVSRYDHEVYAVRERRQREFGRVLAKSIEEMQKDGIADPRLDPEFAAAALGGMVAKIAEMVFVQGYMKVDFKHAVDQITLLWANAVGLPESERRSA